MDRTVDFAAIARVAKRSELRSVRLIEIIAKCSPGNGGALVPYIKLECKPRTVANDVLEVVCDYTFTAHTNEVQVVSCAISYALEYDVAGGESPTTADVEEFARANGALNSWPFVRELLYGLTSKMGYPPYTLPLLHFSTKPPLAAVEPSEAPSLKQPKPE